MQKVTYRRVKGDLLEAKGYASEYQMVTNTLLIHLL